MAYPALGGKMLATVMTPPIIPTVIPDTTPAAKNLARLVGLRVVLWVAELAAVLFAAFALSIPVPVTGIVVVLIAHALINIATWRRLIRPQQVSEHELFTHLLVDVVALTAVLALADGAASPFTLLYLLPVSITAAALPRACHTWSMVAAVAACYSALLVWRLGADPTPHLHNGTTLFDLHVLGMWLGVVTSSCLIAYFAVSMNDIVRQRDHALAQARERALGDERLVALGTLAAGAAHELGTPLATMQIIVGELEHDHTNQPELLECLALLRGQIKRCCDSLATLSASAGNERAQAGRAQTLDEYLHGMLDFWHALRPTIQLRTHWPTSVSPLWSSPMIVADQTLTHALINILNNAADACPQDVEFTAGWDVDTLSIEISDRGPGLRDIDHGAMGRVGFTTKSTQGGLGLGLYLAHAAIGRLGGTVRLEERAGGGTCTRLMLPLARLSTGT